MGRNRAKALAGVQDLLPLDDIVDGVICLRGGDYRAALEVGSVNFALKSEAEQEAIMAGYRAFLNSLSYPIQVVARILPTDVEAYLAGLRERSGGRGSETIHRLALDHETFVRRLARERTLLERRFYVVVPAGLGGAFERTGMRWPWQALQANARHTLEAATRQLNFRCFELIQAMASFGVTTRRLGSTELAGLWNDFLRCEVASASLAVRPQQVVSATKREEASSHA
jgi:hypothetical protein